MVLRTRDHGKCSREGGFFGMNRPVQRMAQAMIVNLNKYRKQLERAEAEQRAAENRVRFGRSKAARTTEEGDRKQSEKFLDDKRLD